MYMGADWRAERLIEGPAWGEAAAEWTAGEPLDRLADGAGSGTAGLSLFAPLRDSGGMEPFGGGTGGKPFIVVAGGSILESLRILSTNKGQIFKLAAI